MFRHFGRITVIYTSDKPCEIFESKMATILQTVPVTCCQIGENKFLTWRFKGIYATKGILDIRNAIKHILDIRNAFQYLKHASCCVLFLYGVTDWCGFPIKYRLYKRPLDRFYRWSQRYTSVSSRSWDKTILGRYWTYDWYWTQDRYSLVLGFWRPKIFINDIEFWLYMNLIL